MSSERRLIIVHCSATPEGREVSAEQLISWHLAPRDLGGGWVRYKGKNYRSRKALPNDNLNGQSIRHQHGRGWRVPGYSVLFHLDGHYDILHPYDYDSKVETWEITNGVRGKNSEAIHICYVGGTDRNNKHPKDTRTKEQSENMLCWIQNFILSTDNGDRLMVAGHNDFDNGKACPSFDVAKWLSGKIEDHYIYQKD